MSILDTPVPRLSERTPLDWRALLLAKLDRQAVSVALFEDYYDGRHPLQFATSKFREAFGALFAAFADNWCQIVVDSSVERLKIVGFRTGGSDGANEDAWSLWQRNSLDVESVIAHTEAGKSGLAFLLVDPNEGEPRITIEHAAQVAVAFDPGDRRKRRAALKRWLGDDGIAYATLYLPDALFKWESADAVREGVPIEWTERDGEPHETTNSLGVVPAIPLENKPGLLSAPHSDLDPAVPLQNAVNKLCTDLIVASEYGAFRQRVLTGVEVPKDPATGQPIAAVELKAAMSRMWSFKAPDAKVYDLPPTDLNNFVVAIEMFIQHLAAQTRTPPHYLLAKLVNTSGDALQVAEAGLVAKCRAKTLYYSDAWEEAMALALTASGAPTEQATCETIWANPERVSQTQLVDAAVKKKSVGVPLEVIWLELGYTPAQIEDMKKLEQSAQEAQLEAQAVAQAAAERVTVQAVPPPGATPTPTPPPVPTTP